MATEELSRAAALARAAILSLEARDTLLRAVKLVEHVPQVDDRLVDMTIGAARSYLEEAYGLLDRLGAKKTEG